MFDPRNEPPSTGRIFKVFIKIAIPAIFTNLTVMVNDIVSFTFAGNIDAT